MCMEMLCVITAMCMGALHVMLLKQLNAISLGGSALKLQGGERGPPMVTSSGQFY